LSLAVSPHCPKADRMASSLTAVSLHSTLHSSGPLTVIASEWRAHGVQQSLDCAGELGRSLVGNAKKLAGLELNVLDLWQALATLAAHDVGVARIVEPHLDALMILRDAGHATLGPDRVDALRWGVFAAEGGDEPLTATQSDDGMITLSGVKPWCSLASHLDAALVTAHVLGEEQRQLFAVRLRSGVEVDDSVWVARGLSEIASGPVRFDAVEAVPVGEPGWYLRRPGFAWGGVAVAACWLGGAIGIGRTVHAALADRATPDPHALAHLGAIDELLQSSRRALGEAALLAQRGDADPRLVAKRVRATVARASDEIIDRAHRALGPAPLALDARHAKRVCDLQLYVLQHHAERDQASLGLAITRGPAPW
jgi:alkylation response protein AidB-like acyl-CoA dehydrogenase